MNEVFAIQRERWSRSGPMAFEREKEIVDLSDVHCLKRGRLVHD